MHNGETSQQLCSEYLMTFQKSSSVHMSPVLSIKNANTRTLILFIYLFLWVTENSVFFLLDMNGYKLNEYVNRYDF